MIRNRIVNPKTFIMKSLKYIFVITACSFLSTGCKKMLEVTPYSEFSPANVTNSEAGIKSLLYSSYQYLQEHADSKDIINVSEVTTDMAYNTGGNANLFLSQFINFAWDPSMEQLEGFVWEPYYKSIRDANLILENIAQVTTTDNNKKVYAAEAKFVRAYAYNYLYSWFGSVPLKLTSDQPKDQARAIDLEMRAQIEKDLTEAAPDLPDPGKEELYGRATKGAAWALLTKFYLNTKQWQKASDAADKVIGLNYYQLFPEFKNMFKVENEGNKEMIFVMTARNEFDYGNWFAAGAMPTAFLYTDQLPEYRWNPNIQNFATHYRLRDAFVNTFNPNDKRFVLVVRKYVNTSNVTVNLQATPDNTRSFKYFDNNAVSNAHGNDIPLLRYADILLAKSEALNELQGVNTTAVSLLNSVRTRAGIPELQIANIASKEAFRDMILRERGWEFISEGKRREDVIRHGKFISLAIQRGVVAKETHVHFPIPQSEIDANKAVVQNPGY